MSDGYTRWDGQPSSPPSARDLAGYSRYEAPPEPTQDWTDAPGGVVKALGWGAGAGVGAYGLKGLLRRAFPGIAPKTSALKSLDAAIQKSESTSGLKQKFSEYIREVSATKKPLTFADFMAQQSGHSNANAIIKDMVQGSGNIPAIDEKLSGRSAAMKGRVLDDIASALGVPKQSVVMGKDALIEARSQKAKPLYDAAFADDAPIKDTRFYSLFAAPAARKALREAVTNSENALKPIEVRSASRPDRKDWWKRMATDDIPEGLFIDDETPGGLRKYIAPNLRNADEIQKSLYAQMKKAMDTDKVTGYEKHTPESRALDTLHDRFMQAMYDTAPNDLYREARKAYAGDSKLVKAHRVGSELLKMTPDEARKAIKGMSPEEREALSQGFYGSMQDMNQQKFFRELVARPERYPERREILSAVFTDPAKLDGFLANLKGEEAMSDSAALFGNPPPSKDAGPRMPAFRLNAPLIGGGDPRMQAIEYIRPEAEKLIPRGLQRRDRAGTDMAFRDPDFMPNGNVGHADWQDINLTPLSGLEIMKRAGRYAGVGALGGLGAYDASLVE